MNNVLCPFGCRVVSVLRCLKNRTKYRGLVDLSLCPAYVLRSLGFGNSCVENSIKSNIVYGLMCSAVRCFLVVGQICSGNKNMVAFLTAALCPAVGSPQCNLCFTRVMCLIILDTIETMITSYDIKKSIRILFSSEIQIT